MQINFAVGSYVWSYLNAKQRSTNPASRNLQYMLKRFHISQRYNLDLTRFSRYYELGYFDREVINFHFKFGNFFLFFCCFEFFNRFF